MSYVLKSLTDFILPSDFDCGEPQLNHFLLKNALESESRGLSTTHLFCKTVEQTPLELVGYFTLTTIPIKFDELNPKLTKRYPNYVKDSLTATLLARLALDKRYQGNKLGGLLLVETLKTVALSWKWVNSIGLLVHAKHDKAASFYRHYGFSNLPEKDLELFLPRKEVLAWLKPLSDDH